MPLHDIKDVVTRLSELGATNVYVKLLANNDNVKQQIYFGGSFDAIRIFPFTSLRHQPGTRRPTFHAKLNFHWIDDEGRVDNAPGSKLILYPNYPEVRLSGFLRGCRTASAERLQPLSRSEREQRQGVPRALILGVTEDDRVIGYVTPWGGQIADQVRDAVHSGRLPQVATVFHQWPLVATPTEQRSQLIERLREVHETGWIDSFRLDGKGRRIAYKAQNGAGYTLEGLLGITPNGTSEPDLLGWELKAHSGAKVTLMTPEPTLGVYSASYVDFMKSYGHLRPDGSGRIDFAGVHRCNRRTERTGLTLVLEGFDPAKDKFHDPAGGLHLYDDKGNLAAGWSFADLMAHWGRKHAKTAFVGYERDASGKIPRYRFAPIVTTAQGAPFLRYLQAFAAGTVIYDPGCNLKPDSTKRSGWAQKKRNQIRIAWKDLDAIYESVEDVDLGPP